MARRFWVRRSKPLAVNTLLAATTVLTGDVAGTSASLGFAQIEWTIRAYFWKPSRLPISTCGSAPRRFA